MLHALAAARSGRDIWWLHGARSRAEEPFAAESRALLAALPSAHRHICYSRPGPGDVQGRDYHTAGRLSASVLAALDLPARRRRLPLRTRRVHGRDVRRPGRGRVSGCPHPHRDLRRRGPRRHPVSRPRPRRPPHPPAGQPGSGPLVAFARSDLTVRWDPGYASLLELAEACDVPVRWSCRTGVCHTCETAVHVRRRSATPPTRSMTPPTAARSSAARSHATTWSSTCDHPAGGRPRPASGDHVPRRGSPGCDHESYAFRHRTRRHLPRLLAADHTGTVRTLSELQGRDPLILTLARGNYCPKEHQQHLELAANYPKIAVAYTQVATIATDDHHTLQEFRASVGAQWTFLSDPGRTVQQDLDIQEYTDPEHDPMIPHTLVLKPGLVIHSVYNGYWFWGRPSFYDLWHDLRAATSEIRPDWDLSTPGLREAWDAGDYSKFHGWDRRSPGSMPTSYVEPGKG